MFWLSVGDLLRSLSLHCTSSRFSTCSVLTWRGSNEQSCRWLTSATPLYTYIHMYEWVDLSWTQGSILSHHSPLDLSRIHTRWDLHGSSWMSGFPFSEWLFLPASSKTSTFWHANDIVLFCHSSCQETIIIVLLKLKTLWFFNGLCSCIFHKLKQKPL